MFGSVVLNNILLKYCVSLMIQFSTEKLLKIYYTNSNMYFELWIPLILKRNYACINPSYLTLLWVIPEDKTRKKLGRAFS